VPYLALVVLFLAGAARVAPSGAFRGGFVWGGVLAGNGAVVFILWSGLRAQRRDAV
jgi:hypothetical protein